MSGWDDDDDLGEEFTGAGGFLQQLQQEQAGEGYATTTMGAFEDENDELGHSSDSDFSDSEFIEDDPEEDLDDDELRNRLSLRKRTINKCVPHLSRALLGGSADNTFVRLSVRRYSKSRYLKVYFQVSIIAQINLYAALFSVQGALANSWSTIILIVIAGILLASQVGQAKEHYEHHLVLAELKDQAPQTDAAKLQEAPMDRDAEMKWIKRLGWHAKMIFFPGIVAIFSTLIFLLGLFTVLFAYGVKHADDGQEICASGPMAVWASMEAAGWAFALWHIFSFGPVLLALAMLSYSHFRSYNDMVGEQAHREELKKRELAKNKGPKFKAETSVDDQQQQSKFVGAGYLRHCFLGSLAFQAMSYVVLFVARHADRPATEGVCINGNTTSLFPKGETCATREAAGHCYSEHPGGDPELTIETVAHCCQSCSGGPLESGGGMLYAISVVGMIMWGYQLGFARSYMARGKDSLGLKKRETLHEANTKLTWHAAGLFYPTAKAMAATFIYFLSVLSLLYYYTENDGSCPRSPLQAITSASFTVVFSPWHVERVLAKSDSGGFDVVSQSCRGTGSLCGCS